MAPLKQFSSRVLVVDDNHDAADSLALFLSGEGFDVRSAYDGIEALAVCREFEPHAVILDLNMPRLDGFETATALFLTQSPPVLIALSADDSLATRERVKQIGFHRQFVKPADIEELRETLQQTQQISW